MVGALAVIGDLVKTRVYAVCRWLNRDGEIIPRGDPREAALGRTAARSERYRLAAALRGARPHPRSQWSATKRPSRLPQQNGFPLELVQQVVRLVERSEYKRQQAAPVLKVTSKSFGMGRRFPIAVKVRYKLKSRESFPRMHRDVRRTAHDARFGRKMQIVAALNFAIRCASFKENSLDPHASVSPAPLLRCHCSCRLFASAQQNVPPAPATMPRRRPQPAAAAPVFPKPDPANFTATSPTKEVVNAFLQTSWGYDENRMWQVQAIQKTQVEGISKVIVYVGDKTGKQKPSGTSVLRAARREAHHRRRRDHSLRRASLCGLSRAAAAEGRWTLSRLGRRRISKSSSSPTSSARIAKKHRPTWRSWPPTFPRRASSSRTIRSAAPEPQRLRPHMACAWPSRAGSTAFFKFAAAVFDGQDGLATPDGATLTLNSAVTKAGLDPAKIAACAPNRRDGSTVEASVKLAKEVNVNQTPTLCQRPPGSRPTLLTNHQADHRVPGKAGRHRPVTG